MSTLHPSSSPMRAVSLLLCCIAVLVWSFGIACDPTSPAGEKSQDAGVQDTGTNDTGTKDTAPVDTAKDAGGTDDQPPADRGAPDTPAPVDTPTDAPGPKDEGGSPDIPPTTHPTCTKSWDSLKQVYADAGAVAACTTAAGKRIAESMFNLANIKIDNNGKSMTPCVDVRCDDKYAYIVTNALPHYDFVQTTPNALGEAPYIYRIPLQPQPIAANAVAEDASKLNGCQDAYKQYMTDSTKGTQTEPSGACVPNQRSTMPRYLNQQEGDQTSKKAKIACFGAIGFVLSGVPIFSPNEGPMPDPFGNPFMYTPTTGDQPPRGAAAMDLCFGHTAASMHHHGVNEACFERTANRAPKQTYAKAAMSWNWTKALTSDCTKESEIVGWSFDGVPIKGACICMKRDASGKCTEFKRARSSWVYGGLKRLGNDPKAQTLLAKEGEKCQNDADCCGGGGLRGCNYRCKPSITKDANAPGGTSVANRCMLLDYSWCVNEHVDRTKEDVSKANFVYLDRCNGYKSADGYAYHVTGSFPLIIGCYNFQPSDSVTRANALLPRRP